MGTRVRKPRSGIIEETIDEKGRVIKPKAAKAQRKALRTAAKSVRQAGRKRVKSKKGRKK